MNILQQLKQVIYSFDLFCSSQLLRYKQQTQYKTITGGLLSLAIIIVVTLGFTSMIADTFNKTSITSNMISIKQLNPTPLTLTTGVQNNFTVINPTQPKAVSHYLEISDFNIFSTKLGASVWLQFADYTINTDNSLLPFPNKIIQTGAIAQKKSTTFTMANFGERLITLNILKSPDSLVYNRQVQKISAVFSYIGGLVGAVTALLFILKTYTDSSLEIAIGIDLLESKGQQKSAPNFNLLCFLKLSLYRILRLLRWKGGWKIEQKIEEYQAQALKQLDIGILLKRLFFIQTCVSYLIEDDQLQELKRGMLKKGSVKNISRMRTLHVISSNQKEPIQVQQYNDELKDQSGIIILIFY